jgi:hypothetical protein
VIAHFVAKESEVVAVGEVLGGDDESGSDGDDKGDKDRDHNECPF